MKVERSYIIKPTRQRLFRLLTSPEILQRCVPGCQSLEANEDGSYKMSLKTGIGSIKGVFTGLIRLEEVTAPNSTLNEKFTACSKLTIDFPRRVCV